MTRYGAPMTRGGLVLGIATALLLLSSVPFVGCSDGDTKSGTGGSAATGGRSGGGGGGGGGGGQGGRTGGGTGGRNQDAGLPDAFNLDALDFDAIAADLGITSCMGAVSDGSPCTSGTDQACRPASGGNLCYCQPAGTWACL